MVAAVPNIRTLHQFQAKVKTQKEVVRIIDDTHYQRHLLEALRTRTLRPAVEVMLWAYPYGKPIEHVEHTGTGSLEDELRALTPDELCAQALAIAAMLKKDDLTTGNRSRETLSETLSAR